MFKKIFLYSLISFTAIANDCLESKYIFDIGSSGIFAQGFEYQKCENKITKEVNQHYTPFFLQKCISKSPDQNMLTKNCLNEANKIISETLGNLKIDCKKISCYGIATAWARNAINNADLLKEFSKHGISIKVISQEQEGILAFKSVLQNYPEKKIDPKKTIIFDIGGGSFQLTHLDDDNVIRVFKGQYGAYNLQAAIKKQFLNNQTKNYTLENVENFVFDSIASELKKDKILTKLMMDDIKILGVGKFFGKGLKTQLEAGDFVDLKKVNAILEKIFNKSAKQIHQLYPKLPLKYSISSQYSLLIIYAILKNAQFAQIEFIENPGVNKFLVTNSLEALK